MVVQLVVTLFADIWNILVSLKGGLNIQNDLVFNISCIEYFKVLHRACKYSTLASSALKPEVHRVHMKAWNPQRMI